MSHQDPVRIAQLQSKLDQVTTQMRAHIDNLSPTELALITANMTNLETQPKIYRPRELPRRWCCRSRGR